MHEPGSDVAIFWDYENCPAPAGSSGWKIVQAIRRVAQAYGSIKVFKAYLELAEQSYSPESRSLQLRSELQASGVSLTDCPHNGRKDVADKMMLVDMMAHAIDNPAPLTYVLISGDRDFAYALAVLRLRCYQVVLVTHSMAHNSLKSQATVCFNWSNILRPIPSGNRNSQTQDRDLIPPGIPHHDVPTDGAFSLRSPSRDSVPYFSEQEDCKVYGADVDAVDYGRRQRHSSISSGSSASFRESTTHTAYFSVQGDSPLLIPLPNISHTNNEYDAVSRPLPSSGSVSRLTSTAGYTRPSSTDGPRPPLGNSGPLPRFLNQLGKHPEPIPVFTPPSLPSNPPVRATNPTNPVPPTVLQHAPFLASSLPPRFQPLVDLLKTYHKNANPRPLRSNIALELNKQAHIIYKDANVERFGQYVALAEQAKIVTLGGKCGDAWIALCPKYCH